WRLATGREIAVDRLTFDGTEFTLVRDADGAYRLQGAPAISGQQATVQVPPDIDVLVRDSRVLYLDAARSIAWAFQDVTASLRRDKDVLTLEAQALPPPEFASRIEVAAQAVVDDAAGAKFTGEWRMSADLDEVDLAVAAQLFPPSAVAPQAGRGDVAVWLEWQGGAVKSGTVELALADVELQSTLGAVDSRFERIAFSGDWERTSEALRLSLRDVAVTRSGRAWPEASTVDIDVGRDADGIDHVALRSSFLRLEDLTPFFAPLPESRVLESWFALAPRGDLRAVDVALTRNADARVDYTVSADFQGLGVDRFEDAPGFTGLTGQVRADSRAGRLELASEGVGLDWPALFRSALDVPELKGTVVWRAGQDAVRVVSDDLLVATPAASTRTNLELTLPMDGSSPLLDLRTSVSEFDLAAAPRYLPANKMPPIVVAWLDSALRGGRAKNAQVTFVGPVLAFPFDGGEGEFRATLDIEGGALAFVSDWPVAEDLDGSVEFVNARFAARGSGRVLGNRTADVRVGIGDLRAGDFTLQAETIGGLDQVLAFLNGAPLIANYLGEDFARLEAPSGTGAVAFDLAMPLREREAFRLTASLDIIDGELAYRGFGSNVTEINGSLALADGVLRGDGIQAIFLDGPLTAAVSPAGVPGYRARIDVEGEVTIDAVVSAFNLPYGDLLAGQTAWQGTLLLPAAAGAQSLPPKITVASNLSGVALRFPEPFAKPPGEPTNLELNLTFPIGALAMDGYVGATRRFVLDFDATQAEERPFTFRRAALEFGGELAEFRADRGITLNGSLPKLSVDEWLALSRSGDQGGVDARANWSGAFAGADLNVAEFSVFGQQLGSTRVAARRRTDDWQFELDSNAIAGTLLVPMDLRGEPQVVAVMRRLYLNAGDGSGAGIMSDIDPRELPGVQLHADEFGVGTRQIGRLDAEILADPLGLRLVSFESATDSFTAQGSGGWFVGDEGADTTRFAVGINSTNVGEMLRQLGVAPFVEAETAEVTASLYWPGPPSAAWLDHIAGDLALRAEKGSLVDVAPGGAGRAAGLLSISALPRRLALDFRDVFNRGFVFDDITADFVIVDGNAYTDNLKLTGPVAEVGLIGRTGLRDRDYRQQVVVTAEPGKVLPTVGALLAGPQVAAALLIFTRIFKKPLGGIGRASYCVTGSWSEPIVERLTDEQLEQGAVCAELPPTAAIAIPKPQEVAAR
ncbi:MAG TPA: YhdP family protein, partial [Gammaproteobacteria bacterium]|nr:YhdP family protein [Gammaproteobacteria bacterium]